MAKTLALTSSSRWFDLYNVLSTFICKKVNKRFSPTGNADWVGQDVLGLTGKVCSTVVVQLEQPISVRKILKGLS